MSRVTRQQAEFLYARGYRAENAPLDGPRAVRDLQWVYITITPAEMAGFHWAVWSKGMGAFLEGGTEDCPLFAATKAEEWAAKEYMESV